MEYTSERSDDEFRAQERGAELGGKLGQMNEGQEILKGREERLCENSKWDALFW